MDFESATDGAFDEIEIWISSAKYIFVLISNVSAI